MLNSIALHQDGESKLNKFYDRFLVVDENELFHIGASLKDLGSKIFAFSKLHVDVEEFIKRLK